MARTVEYSFGHKVEQKSMLTFLFVDANTSSHKKAFFLCECGNVKSIRIDSIVNGDTISCGCEARKRASARKKTHGLSKHPLANTYYDMCKRCYNKNRSDYKHYGGRGIKVCKRWLGEYGLANFIEDLKTKPVGMELDRKDVNGDYEPSNVAWANRSEQCFNRRRGKVNKSGRVGVYWHEQSKRWRASITHQSKRIGLGNYRNFKDAVAAREEAEIRYFGYHPNYETGGE